MTAPFFGVFSSITRDHGLRPALTGAPPSTGSFCTPLNILCFIRLICYCRTGELPGFLTRAAGGARGRIQVKEPG